MKEQGWSWPSFLAAWLYGAALAGAALSCPVTCYALPVSLARLWLVCAAAAGVWSLLWHLPGRTITLPCAVAAGLLCLWWQRQPVAGGFSCLLERLTESYAGAYPGVPVICLLEQANPSADAFFAAAAVLLAGLIAGAVARQWTAWLPLGLCAPWLAMCLVVVDTLPALWALLALLGTSLLLLFSQSIRAEGRRAGFRLTLFLALPVAAVLGLLLWLQPPADYVRDEWPDALREQGEQLLAALAEADYGGQAGSLDWSTALFPAQSHTWSAGRGEVDLTRLGPRKLSSRKVLELRTQTAQTLYLRAASLSGYADNCWEAETQNALPEGFDPLAGYASDGELDTAQIRTASVAGQLFTPYFLAAAPGGTLMGDDDYANSDRLRSYEVRYFHAPASLRAADPAGQADYAPLAYAAALSVPAQTREGLLALAEAAGLTALPAVQLPEAVADYVRSAAVYDLQVERMPAGEDFALWFLTESHRGYCVHFATAAALMLRTLGVPARYVTGYLAQSEAGVWTQVTEAQAHAWVEYYMDGLGWLPLEVTPGAALPQPAPDTQPEPDQPVEPSQPQQQPDQPGEPDAPDAPSEPNPQEEQNTQPGGAEQPPAGAAAGRGADCRWLCWVGLALLLAALALASRPLRIAMRQRRLHAGTANAQALALWQRVQTLARHAGTPPPAELRVLAQKARFSRHTLFPEELASFSVEIERLTAQLRAERGLLRRLKIRWIWADC